MSACARFVLAACLLFSSSAWCIVSADDPSLTEAEMDRLAAAMAARAGQQQQSNGVQNMANLRQLELTAQAAIKASEQAIASSQEAVKSSQDNLELFLTIGGVVGVILTTALAALGLLGFKSTREFAKRYARRLKRLSDVSASMMTVERFLEFNGKIRDGMFEKLVAHEKLTTRDAAWTLEQEALQTTLSLQHDVIAADIRELHELNELRLQEVGREPRWSATILSAEGMLYMHRGAPDLALNAFQRAIKECSGEDRSSRIRKASHLYNASCAASKINLETALKYLGDCLDIVPRYWLDLAKDQEWGAHVADQRVQNLIARAKVMVTYGPQLQATAVAPPVAAVGNGA